MEGKQRISFIHFLGTVALGAFLVISTGNGEILNSENTQFWLNQAKTEFNWNVTSTVSWTATNKFIGVAVSPIGDLYGIQTYSDGRTDVQYAYKYDFIKGTWVAFDTSILLKGMRFDKQGNVYFIDKSDNLIQHSSKAKLLSGV